MSLGRTAESLFTMLALSLSFCVARAQVNKKAFTVADDIGYSHFIPDGYSSGFLGVEGTVFSPNGEFFVVLTARGRLDLNQVEESVRFYRSKDVEGYLRHSGQVQPPSPTWIVNRYGKKEPIGNIRWLADSSGVAIQEHTNNEDDDRVVLLDLLKRTTEILPAAVSKYEGFDVADRGHYVYVANDQDARKELEAKRGAERRAPMTVFDGTDGWDLVFSDQPGVIRRRLADRKHLWAAVGGKRFEVKANGAALAITDFGSRTLALSPDGNSLVTTLKVKNIPQAWEKFYPPPYPTAPYNSIHAGGAAMQYVLIDLNTGAVHPLTGAPIADDAGWAAAGQGAPSWSKDGKAILLPGTFLAARDNRPSRPCIAVVDVASDTSTCVETLKSRTGPGLKFEANYHWVWSAEFVDGDKDNVAINFMRPDESTGNIEYRHTPSGDWQVIGQGDGFNTTGGDGHLQISVKQRFDQPPVLVAADKKHSRMIWDPNPQFQNVDLGQVRIYKWTDTEGTQWEGGLFMPAGYQPGLRYPLVIQTHGFSEAHFAPSGAYPTAFAARELAADGIAVLQVGGSERCSGGEEATCEVSGFDSGARQLIRDGIVNPRRIGYIGFSRSCWYGMEMLTNGTVPLKAALLADGITVSYLEFIFNGIDFHDLLGATPFGNGLQTWVKRSPGFHLEKVNAPVLIAVEKDAAIGMWQTYAGMHYLEKPVELELMNTDEHVITNPVERLASQGLSVEWFRFWLQDYEDPAPAKAAQYKRWRELRKLRAKSKHESG